MERVNLLTWFPESCGEKKKNAFLTSAEAHLPPEEDLTSPTASSQGSALSLSLNSEPQFHCPYIKVELSSPSRDHLQQLQIPVVLILQFKPSIYRLFFL